MVKKAFRNDEFINNPAARIPICLCLDVSGSMNETIADGTDRYGEYIGCRTKMDFLKNGIRTLYDDLKANPNTRYAADIAIVTFSDGGNIIADFAGVRQQPSVLELESGGMTEMGTGVNLALNLLNARKNEYKSAGLPYYQPWLFLMTDGDANGNVDELRMAQRRVNDSIQSDKLIFIPVGFGTRESFCRNNELNHFSDSVKAVRYDVIDYPIFFKWIGESMDSVARSRTSEIFIPGEMPRGYEYMD